MDTIPNLLRFVPVAVDAGAGSRYFSEDTFQFHTAAVGYVPRHWFRAEGEGVS